MRLTKPHPVLASFSAAAVALFPVVVTAVLALTDVPGSQAFKVPDNSELRMAGVALILIPFLYVVAVPICYGAGALLLRIRLRSLGRFLTGTAVLAALLGSAIGMVLGMPSQYGASDIASSVVTSIILALFCALPAAVCWWILAAQPTNRAAKKKLH